MSTSSDGSIISKSAGLLGDPDSPTNDSLLPRWRPHSVGSPRGWAGVAAEEATTVAFTIADATATASWTLQRKDGGWVLHDGAPEQPNATVAFDLDTAAHLFSRGLAQTDIQRRVRVEGDTDLAQMFVGGLAAFFGQET
ncbi:MAG: SCP2 sterol-binding domain-containing protein [Actinomycetota bacterium]|nr:SCP2 sterol-binding domain-containing protein [Actinomycetota bacterium]